MPNDELQTLKLGSEYTSIDSRSKGTHLSAVVGTTGLDVYLSSGINRSILVPSLQSLQLIICIHP